MKKFIPAVGALAMALALAACGNSTTTTPATAAPAANNNQAPATVTATVENEPAAAPGAAGFEEIPIFEDEEVGFISANAVYFQPVPMAPGQENYEDYDMHLELDVSAMENELGYEIGSWIPYLTIDYRVYNADGDAASGTMMHMAASDGPHYGANIKLPNAGTYSLEFTIHSPAELGYMVHADSETGPGGLLDDPEYWGNGNMVLTVEDCWDYVPQEW